IADLAALAFANALDDALLRGLHGSTSEFGKVDGNFHRIANLELFVFVAGFFEGDFARRIGDFGDHGLEQRDADTAARLIDLDFGLDSWSILFRERGKDTVLQEPNELRPVDLLRVGQLADRVENVCRTCHPNAPSKISSRTSTLPVARLREARAALRLWR